jgi:hypothetical protein
VASVGERPPGAAAGVLDLYRAMVEEARAGLDAARRRRVAIAVEVSLIAVYVVLRTVDAGRSLLQVWSLVTALVAIASPTSGLVVLAAIAPFSEPFSVTRQLGVKPFLVLAVGAGGVLRALPIADAWRRGRGSAAGVAAGERSRTRLLPWAAIAGAALLLVGTGLGVAHTRLAFGADMGSLAAQSWLAGLGGGLIVLLVAVLVGRSGTLRPVVVAVASALVGAAVSLADYLKPESIRGAAFAWLLRPDRFQDRLTGIIPSPNGVAALLIVPTGVLVAIAVLGRDIRLRVGAAAGAVLMAVSLYFTYSRAALIGLVLIAIVVAWRFRRPLGVALLVVSVVGGILVLPTYLRARNEAVGGEGNVRPGDLLVASDAYRFRAWGSAGQMFLDSPLTGQGFLSYQWLHDAYGDPILRSPHNEWLRFFAEEGVVVGLAGIVFLVATAATLALERGALASGILGGFLGFAVAASFNNPFLYVQVLAIAGTILGIGIGRRLRGERPPPPG